MNIRFQPPSIRTSPSPPPVVTLPHSKAAWLSTPRSHRSTSRTPQAASSDHQLHPAHDASSGTGGYSHQRPALWRHPERYALCPPEPPRKPDPPPTTTPCKPPGINRPQDRKSVE